MKKNIVRGSVLTVAALSLLIGGTSQVSLKEQVGQSATVVGKAIENRTADNKDLVKGEQTKKAVEVAKVDQAITPVTATTDENTVVADDSAEGEAPVEEIKVEERAAKVESNQVVANIEGYLNIREEASEDSDVVGKFYNGNVGTIVEKGDQWSLVASGNAYGYVNNDYLLFGEDAEDYIENNCDQVAKVTAETLNIRAEESAESDVVNQIDEGAKLTILGKEGDWIKVAASEEQVGYVAKDFVYIDYVYETAVTIEEEEAAAEAERIADEEAQRAEEEAQQQTVENDNQETVQEAPATEAPREETTEAPQQEEKEETATSTDIDVSDDGSNTDTVYDEAGSGLGQEIADYACRFVGNPYVYGGTSLTNGADCSGFVMSVYAHFGYSLPRVAADQAGAGKKVSVDNLQPGDLLFYHGFGHVAIYVGNGTVVHASNAATGIKYSDYNYSPIDKAVRIVY